MDKREEFEKWYDIIYKQLFGVDRFRDEFYIRHLKLSYQVYQEATTRQQKKIDELEEEKESRQRACDDCMMRFSKTISQLEADNPDVDCPECHNHENPEMICTFCMEKGTVSTVKALQYEIEHLKKVNKLLQESLDDDLIKTLKAMEA